MIPLRRDSLAWVVLNKNIEIETIAPKFFGVTFHRFQRLEKSHGPPRYSKVRGSVLFMIRVVLIYLRSLVLWPKQDVPFMSDKNAEPHDNGETNEVNRWVQSQLSPYHLGWLENQRDFVDPTEILKFALAEWVIRHPEDWFGDLNVEIAMRSALEEFIIRHKEEFITMG